MIPRPDLGPFDPLRFSPLAEDLQPIEGRILGLAGVPVSLWADWLYQLAQIDQSGRIDRPGRMAPGSAGEKARNLAGAIAAAHANIRSVVSAVGYQATKCRWYWNV